MLSGIRSRGEMDIIAAFEAVVGGSSPSGSTRFLVQFPDLRPWLSGIMRPCQGRVGSSILPGRTGLLGESNWEGVGKREFPVEEGNEVSENRGFSEE